MLIINQASLPRRKLPIIRIPVWLTPSGPLLHATAKQPYSVQIQAVDPDTELLTYSMLSGSLPDGVTMTTNGLIEGSPTTAGLATFVILVSNYAGYTIQRFFSISVT